MIGRGRPLLRISCIQEGLPVSSSGLGEQTQPWMAERSGHGESGGLEARRERPARGYGQPRPTQDAD